jgi:peptide-methionine (S)-S-oxide reductase
MSLLHRSTANYETVSSGVTGHVESVEITFDPQEITYGRVLQIYFSVVQDPTELNRQGPDYGTQYRSVIFPRSEEQARIARAYINQLDQTHSFKSAIVTTIEPNRDFYPAEAYHQNFLVQNPTNPYIVINDLPKIAALQRVLPIFYRPQPVLVVTSASSK